MLFLTIVCIDDGILLLVGVGVEEIGGEGRGGGGGGGGEGGGKTTLIVVLV